MNQLYTIDYIRRAISSDAIERPDAARAGDNFQTLEYLYFAHKSAQGTPKPPQQAARDAWNTIAREVPALGHLYEMQKYLYTAPQLTQIQPMTYMLDGYPLYERGFNVLIGVSGGGKSFVAVDIAARVVHEQKKPILYIGAEGAETYDSRLQGWHQYYDLDITDRFYLFGHAVDTGDPAKFKAFVEHVFKPIKPYLIIVDTVARCMVGMDENSSSDMKKFVAIWDELREMGATLLFVHHVNKKGDMRGSKVLQDSADSVLFLRRVDNAIVVRNDHEGGGKNKGAKEAPPMYFKIASVDVPGTDYVGDDSAGVLQKATKKDIDLSEVGNLLDGQLEILRLLEGLEEGMTNAELVEQLTGRVSKSSVYRYTNVLSKSGYIVRQAGMYTLTDKGQTALNSNPEAMT